jgi:V/A-type H+/Na+-transporting ATPase subunit A
MTVRGKVVWISGPAVKADGMAASKMFETVEVGEARTIGEVIRLTGDTAFIQVYESTSGLRPGEPVYGTGQPLSVSLGPGMMGKIYDGLQRPLDILGKSGVFIARGASAPQIGQDQLWDFTPRVRVGDRIIGGSILGVVPETRLIEHRVLAPPTLKKSRVTDVVKRGKYRIDEVVVTAECDGEKIPLKMYHRWPVRTPRPILTRYDPQIPLMTGQRVFDTYFPIAKGGTAAMPGGFGSGKTVALHQIATWADAKVVFHVGCGERGNEMTEVLIKFPALKDPSTAYPLMERTILVANTSNMPVAAREASIYTGTTMAEYYRDMGYDTLLVADSTSRWAEALREISGRLEEMPAEEGYPPYLASRLADFYERAGRVKALGTPERTGSVTLIGAVSPTGADFTEPVTANTIRFVSTFWALDTNLAYSRHYPAINWMTSYSGYVETVARWWAENVNEDWMSLRAESYEILQKEDVLKEIVRLLGPAALPDEERLVLDVARLIKMGYLQQSAYDPVDTYCSPRKQVKLLEIFVTFYREALGALAAGATLSQIENLPAIPKMIRAKFEIKGESEFQRMDQLLDEIRDSFKALTAQGAKAVSR